jgi:hypothetical protein
MIATATVRELLRVTDHVRVDVLQLNGFGEPRPARVAMRSPFNTT